MSSELSQELLEEGAMAPACAALAAALSLLTGDTEGPAALREAAAPLADLLPSTLRGLSVTAELSSRSAPVTAAVLAPAGAAAPPGPRSVVLLQCWDCGVHVLCWVDQQAAPKPDATERRALQAFGSELAHQLSLLEKARTEVGAGAVAWAVGGGAAWRRGSRVHVPGGSGLLLPGAHRAGAACLACMPVLAASLAAPGRRCKLQACPPAPLSRLRTVTHSGCPALPCTRLPRLLAGGLRCHQPALPPLHNGSRSLTSQARTRRAPLEHSTQGTCHPTPGQPDRASQRAMHHGERSDQAWPSPHASPIKTLPGHRWHQPTPAVLPQ